MPEGRRSSAWLLAALVGVALGVAVYGLVLQRTATPLAADTDALGPDAETFLAERGGTLTVGWPDFPPMATIDAEGRVAGGYAVEAWDLAALKLGFDVQHVHVGTPGDVVAALEEGTIDVAGSLGPREDVAAFAAPSEPFAWVPSVLVGPPTLAGASSFAGLTATTVAGSPLVDQLAAAYPDIQYVETESPAVGVALVAAGDVDLYFGPLALVGAVLQRQEVELVPIGDAVSVVEVTSWAQDAGAAAVAAAARSSITDDELRLLHVRWTGFDLTDPAASAGAPAWLTPLLWAFAVVLLVLAAAAVVLRLQVRRATADLQRANEQLEDEVAERTAELSQSAARLKRSNAALKRFTTTAAHDLKGPLAAITGLADVAITMDLPEQQEEDLLRRVRGSAQRLGRMVDDMLEDAVNMGAEVASLTGPAFADWLEEVTAPELEVIDGRLVVVAPDEPLEVDVEVLRRAAINLVGNAVKYAVNEAGMLVHAVLSREGDTWELRVDDNGPGIPQAMWSEIFERGRRLTHDDRGFGLGLAAIRDLVQGAGGAIRVGEADIGGASFVVTLPVRTPSAPVALDEAAQVESTARGD